MTPNSHLCKEKKKIIKRIFIGMSIFILMGILALGMFLLVWNTAPKENILWLKESYNGLFQYLLIGVYSLSVLMINVRKSIDLSRIIEERGIKW